MNNLILFKEKWGKTYPSCVKSWEENWDILSTFFAYPPEVRKIIYTTNIIEGLNRQFRQITKNKPSFTNDDSLRKMLYLASQKIVERWTQRCRNWDIVLSQLSIIFEDRIPAWFAPENRISCPQNVISRRACITFRRQERKVNTGQIRKPDYTAIRCFVIAWRIIIYTEFYGVPSNTLCISYKFLILHIFFSHILFLSTSTHFIPIFSHGKISVFILSPTYITESIFSPDCLTAS